MDPFARKTFDMSTLGEPDTAHDPIIWLDTCVQGLRQSPSATPGSIVRPTVSLS